jgi:hypothetical protein
VGVLISSNGTGRHRLRLQPLIASLACGIGLLLSLWIPLSTSLKGVVVETNPIFWVFLSLCMGLAFTLRKRDVFCSLLLVFFIGLCLRLIPVVHSYYPEFDPWNELASIHHIENSGFNLRGNYYHSDLPVLQLLLLTFIPVFGEYNTLAYLGPVLGWVLAFICLYKLGREFFDVEKVWLLMLIYSCANIGFQFFTAPETIALSFGFASVFFFHRNLVKSSVKYSLATLVMFTLLVFTHHLTAFCVVVATGAIIVVLILRKAKITNAFLWLGLLSIFLAYYELYQGLLSSMLVIRVTQVAIGIPTGWPKPLWWWVLYFLPMVLLALMLTTWIVPPLIRKKITRPIEVLALVIAGGVSLVFGFFFPSGLPPLRIFNQFGAHFFNGALNARLARTFSILLACSLLLGVVTAFPMTNGTDYYVGGYWINHSPEEIQAIEYFVNNASANSRIIADGRIRPVLNGLAPENKNLSASTLPQIIEVYETNSTQQAWDFCVRYGFTYVFVSSFYKVIAQFDVYGGAARFSDAQLSKFEPPYFSLWYNNSQVSIYSVNTIQR